MPGPRARGTSIALCAIAVLATSTTATAQRTSSLSWVRLEGAEDCISTQTLARRVEERIGRRVFVSASEADLSLEGHVRRDGDSMLAELAVSDPRGEILGRRVLRVAGTQCEALEASLVLVIAIGIDPNASLPATDGLSTETRTMLSQLELPKLNEAAVLELAVPDPAKRPDAAAPSGGARARPLTRPSTPPPGAARLVPDFELGIHTGIGAELGVLPDPSFGLTLRIALRAGSVWPFELSFAGFLPQTREVPPAGGSSDFGFWAIGLAVCPDTFEARPIGLRACAGARVGRLHARGRRLDQPLSAASGWLEPMLQAGPRLQLDRFRLDLSGRIGVPILRDTFGIENEARVTRPVHRAAALVGGIELSAGMIF